MLIVEALLLGMTPASSLLRCQQLVLCLWERQQRRLETCVQMPMQQRRRLTQAELLRLPVLM